MDIPDWAIEALPYAIIAVIFAIPVVVSTIIFRRLKDVARSLGGV